MSNLSKLLQWGITNSGAVPAEDEEPRRQPTLDPALIAQLFGGKDDAQMMVEAMQCIASPAETLENREIAFDNLEQLIENLDNANNLENLKLWPPLVAQLTSPDTAMRYMASWVVGTAVQNNVKSQECFHKYNAADKLVYLALNDEAKDVRSKAIYAISSYVRNYQDGLEEVLDALPEEDGMKEEYKAKKIDAEDMDAIDAFREDLRHKGAKKLEAKGALHNL